VRNTPTPLKAFGLCLSGLGMEITIIIAPGIHRSMLLNDVMSITTDIEKLFFGSFSRKA